MSVQHSQIKLSHKLQTSWPVFFQQTDRFVYMYPGFYVKQYADAYGIVQHGHQCIVSAHLLSAASMCLVSWCGAQQNHHPAGT